MQHRFTLFGIELFEESHGGPSVYRPRGRGHDECRDALMRDPRCGGAAAWQAVC
jgi:hypothetical protein